MQTTISIYAMGAGFGYRLESDAGHRYVQDFDPTLPNYQPFATEASARAHAAMTEAEVLADVPEPEPAPE